MGKNERVPRTSDQMDGTQNKQTKKQNALNPDYRPPIQNAMPDPGPKKNRFPWIAAAALLLALAAGVFLMGREDSPGQSIREPDAAAQSYQESEAPTELQVTEITLKVWAPLDDQLDDNSWLVRMEKKFEELHPEYDITWENGVCNEGDAAALLSADPANGADVYMFANDQLGTLVSNGMLARLGGDYLDQVENDVSATYINTVTHSDGGVYGFPIAPNTWFMYYNKAILTEEDVKSLEACLAKGVVAFELGNSWYLPSFFFANGCTLFGETGANVLAGAQLGGEAGYQAAERLLELCRNPNFRNDADRYGNAGLKNGTVAAYFSGSWDYADLYAALGKNLGAAPPPTVLINGQEKQLMAYAGSKAVGVNPNSRQMKAAMQFAALLASADSQLLRFELRGITPAAGVLFQSPLVSSSIVAAAELATMEYASVAQPSIPAMNYVWGPMSNFGAGILNGSTHDWNVRQMVDAMVSEINSNF